MSPGRATAISICHSDAISSAVDRINPSNGTISCLRDGCLGISSMCHFSQPVLSYKRLFCGVYWWVFWEKNFFVGTGGGYYPVWVTFHVFFQCVVYMFIFHVWFALFGKYG